MRKILNDFIKDHKLSPRAESGRCFIFDCPACGGDKKLYIEKDTGFSTCFKQKTDKCLKSRSKPEWALTQLTGIPIRDIKDEIYGFIKISDDSVFEVKFDDENEIKVKKKIDPIPKDKMPPDLVVFDLDPNSDGFKYLRGRGITDEMIKKYNICYSLSMRRAIFFTIMNKEIYGWQGRAVDKVAKEYRMYNLPGEWKSKSLMFYDNLKGSEHAILAEGPVSALKFEKVGGFVASMGKNVSPEQLDLIRESGIKKLYIALDRDAFDKINKICKDINNPLYGKSIECYLVEVPEHRDDFGDCTYDECEAAFKSAVRVYGDELHITIGD